MPRSPDRPEKPTGARLGVLVIRHAPAGGRAAFAESGKPDALRPLTRAGGAKMRHASRGLARLVPRVDALATSPLARAVETGAIVAARFGGLRPSRLAALAPGKSAGQVLDWLRDQRPGAVVAIVGHEPDLGQLISWLLTGLRESFVPLKKGAACLLEFDGEIKPARAKLVWAMKPSQLRQLGRRKK